MPIFHYQALTTAGRALQGTLEAASLDQAQQALRELQLQVNSVEQAAPAPTSRPVGRHEFLLFNQQLAGIARSGLPLERALRALSHDAAGGRLRRLLDEIAGDLEQGVPLDEAIDRHRGAFPPLYERIIRAGIRSGRLGAMLTSLNRHLEATTRTRRVVVEAALYPLLVTFMSLVILSGIFAFIVPHFGRILDGFGGRLPDITEFILAVPPYVGPCWLAVFVVLGVCTFTWVTLRHTAGGRRLRERIILQLPLVGRLYRTGLLARLADVAGLLVDAGCDLPSVLRLAADATGSELIRRDAELVAVQVEQGAGIVEAGSAAALVPTLFFYSMQLGSQRQELAPNLYGLADMYAQQTQMGQSRLQALLTPQLLLLTGGIVLFVVIALLAPLFTVMGGFVA